MSIHDVSEFSILKGVTEKIAVIRSELLALTDFVMPIDRVNKNHDEIFNELQVYLAKGGQYGWMTGDGKLGGNPNWLQYGLVLYDQPVADAANTMPKTMAILQAMQGIKVCLLAKLLTFS